MIEYIIDSIKYRKTSHKSEFNKVLVLACIIGYFIIGLIGEYALKPWGIFLRYKPFMNWFFLYLIIYVVNLIKGR